MSLSRIHHPYWDWEDWKAGMWRAPCKEDEREFLSKAVAFTGDHLNYGFFMRRVVREWPKACEHNLTEPSMNRLAWIGHAATVMAIGCPEWVTRKAWGMLTAEQRRLADAQAQLALDEWIEAHEAKDCGVHPQMEIEGLSEWDPGSGRPSARGTVQSAELSDDLQSNPAQRPGPNVTRLFQTEDGCLHGTQADRDSGARR